MENGEREDSTSEEVRKAIDYCDPKLVQIILGPRYCQLWQYWITRAIFNFDFLSMCKMAECDLPLCIAEVQLQYLQNKGTRDTEMDMLVREKMREENEKRDRFYEFDRILQLINEESNEDHAGARKFGGNSMMEYWDLNRGFGVRDSISAAIYADFSDECRRMITESDEEDQKGISVSQLINHVNNRIAILKESEDRIKTAIEKILNQIIKPMQDNKFVGKSFVHEAYSKLFDHYVLSITADMHNPLKRYYNQQPRFDNQKVKEHLMDRRVKYCFSEFIEHAVKTYNDESDPTRKKDCLDVIKVLIINGAYTESLSKIFVTPELKELSLLSIFTVAKDVHNILFDFDKLDTEYVSCIVGKDAKSANPFLGNVPFLIYTGSPIVRTTLQNLKLLEADYQMKRESGKVNRKADICNRILYSITDFIHETVINQTLLPNSMQEQDKTYRLLYQTLDAIYLCLASGDDRVLIDYTRKIDVEFLDETNQDIIDLIQCFKTNCKDLNIKSLPSNCVINWLGATYRGVERLIFEELEKEAIQAKITEEKHERIQKLNDDVEKLFYEILEKYSFNDDFKKAIDIQKSNILKDVVGKVIEYNLPPQKLIVEAIENFQLLEESTPHIE